MFSKIFIVSFYFCRNALKCAVSFNMTLRDFDHVDNVVSFVPRDLKLNITNAKPSRRHFFRNYCYLWNLRFRTDHKQET